MESQSCIGARRANPSTTFCGATAASPRQQPIRPAEDNNFYGARSGMWSAFHEPGLSFARCCRDSHVFTHDYITPQGRQTSRKKSLRHKKRGNASPLPDSPPVPLEQLEKVTTPKATPQPESNTEVEPTLVSTGDVESLATRQWMIRINGRLAMFITVSVHRDG